MKSRDVSRESFEPGTKTMRGGGSPLIGGKRRESRLVGSCEHDHCPFVGWKPRELLEWCPRKGLAGWCPAHSHRTTLRVLGSCSGRAASTVRPAPSSDLHHLDQRESSTFGDPLRKFFPQHRKLDKREAGLLISRTTRRRPVAPPKLKNPCLFATSPFPRLPSSCGSRGGEAGPLCKICDKFSRVLACDRLGGEVLDTLANKRSETSWDRQDLSALARLASRQELRRSKACWCWRSYSLAVQQELCIVMDELSVTKSWLRATFGNGGEPKKRMHARRRRDRAGSKPGRSWAAGPAPPANLSQPATPYADHRSLLCSFILAAVVLPTCRPQQSSADSPRGERRRVPDTRLCTE